MADGIVQVPPNSTGAKIDAASLDVAANTVMRQRIVIADNTASAGFAAIINSALAVVRPGFDPAIMSVSHGPKCVQCSTSAVVTLIASPGAGANLYITQLMVGNASGSVVKARIGTSASASTVVQPCAANGGGFVLSFDPPWMLSASEAAICSIKPSVSEAFFTVNYYVR